MTSEQVLEQIMDIREVTAKARVSKEAAAAFLIRAGIIEKWDPAVNTPATPNGIGTAADEQSAIKPGKSLRPASHKDLTSK